MEISDAPTISVLRWLLGEHKGNNDWLPGGLQPGGCAVWILAGGMSLVNREGRPFLLKGRTFIEARGCESRGARELLIHAAGVQGLSCTTKVIVLKSGHVTHLSDKW